MVALGLFLLVIAGLLTAAMFVQNTEASTASVFGQAISGLTVGGLFVAGVLTGAAALLGVLLMLAGARRRGRRGGLKREVRDVRSEKETLADENARLLRELEDSRSGSAAYPDDAASRDGNPVGKHSETDVQAPGKHRLFHR